MSIAATTPRRGEVLLLIAHHKSGTYVANEFFQLICPKNHIEQIDWGLIQCSSKKIRFSMQGVMKDLHIESASNTILHFIRHPLDMLVSGYLYHKACREGWTARIYTKNDANLLRFPHGMIFPVTSYCNTLRQLKTKEGIGLELHRSLGSGDGIGKMMKDIHVLKEKTTAHVMNICLKDYMQLADEVENIIKPWIDRNNIIERNISLKNVPINEHHMTDQKLHQELYEIAYELINKEMTTETLMTFPCQPEYYLNNTILPMETLEG